MGGCMSSSEATGNNTNARVSHLTSNTRDSDGEDDMDYGGNDFAGSSMIRQFKMKELELATGKFRKESVLGEGSFGKVYLGYVKDWTGELNGKRRAIAVKKLDPGSFQGAGEWLAEVLLLGKLRHPNLVRLLGYCTYGEDERLLVYEFMDYGSLDYLLYHEGGTREPLTWQLRVKIALEAATGLAYLHSENIIHRDLKSSNILLDENLVAKVTDFGLATSAPDDKTHKSTRIMGTKGYLDPRYVETGHLSLKSDVYAFGMVLLELLTGQRPAGGPNEEDLASKVAPYLAQRRPDLSAIIDPRLNSVYNRSGAQKFAVLAKHCINEDPQDRPQMEDLIAPLTLISGMTTNGDGRKGGSSGPTTGGDKEND